MHKFRPGTLLAWEEVQKHSPYVKEQAIRQFIRLFPQVKDRTCSTLTWGDETEYLLIRLNHEEQRAYLTCNNEKVISDVKRYQAENSSRNTDKIGCYWTPEFIAHMVESTPLEPFGGSSFGFEFVQRNIKFRREQVNRVLVGDDVTEDICISLSYFPRYWCRDSTIPSKYSTQPTPALVESIHIQDFLTSLPRCRAVSENIPKRNGLCPSIHIPVFKDESTDSNIAVSLMDGERVPEARPWFIPATGPEQAAGVACLQLTFQCSDFSEARLLHDQLAPLCPIMMALSASTPICKGYLMDWDCRYNIYSGCFDYRTAAERGIGPLKDGPFIIPKSPWTTVNGYVSRDNAVFNDVQYPYDDEIYKEFLTAEGIDTCFARHMARLFVGDPLFVMEQNLHQTESSSNHLQNIVGTRWPSVKLKMPEADDEKAGWRLEFRPMGIQLTDFENSAYLIFMVLLTRAVLTLKLDFVMSLSKVDSNMDKASARDASRQQTFAFRAEPSADAEERSLCEMSMDTIINGGNTAGGIDFPGLIPLIRQYLATQEDHDTGFRPMIESYLNVISDRAAGRIKTTAQWIRHYVLEHPEYKQDSIVSSKICYDLVKLCNDIQKEKVEPEHLDHLVQ